MWCAQNHSTDKAIELLPDCQSSFYQIEPPATLPCKDPRTPHLFLYELMRVSQILVVSPLLN